MKKILLSLSVILVLTSCDPKLLGEIATTVLEQAGANGVLSDAQIGSGLKEALNIGISNGVDVLSSENGYYKSAYKILLPPEAQKITQRLSRVPGFSDVEEVLLKKINRGAEDAAVRAKPIFVSALRNMTFTDAKNILLGEKNAATTYLNTNTYNNLYGEFNPVIVKSLDKFSARQYWRNIVKNYNKIPLVNKVNPELDQYITNEALKGLFSMVEVKEKDIRANISSRTSDILRRVFALQDEGAQTNGGM